MPKTIGRENLQQLMQEARKSSKSPKRQYEYAHLPRALSLPLKQLEENVARSLKRGRPIVVYCSHTE